MGNCASFEKSSVSYKLENLTIYRIRLRAVEELRSLNLNDTFYSKANQELADSFLIPTNAITRLASVDEINRDDFHESKEVN